MSERDSRHSPSIRPLSMLVNGDQTALLVSESPSKKTKTAKGRCKIRPPMRRGTSLANSKFIYSVDDDVNDEVDDSDKADEVFVKRDKKYIDGYHDALRDFYQHKKTKMADVQGPGLPSVDSDLHHPMLKKVLVERTDPIDEAGEIGALEPRGSDEENEVIAEGQEDAEDAKSTISTSSSGTLESLNLKDRQNAINLTHPFGIKIWKPSIYKKNRSVAVRADEDIHDFEPRRPTSPIFIGVYATNLIWSCTFGLLLCTLCFIGAIIVFVCSGFAWHRSLRPYVKLLVQLGKYWLYPFGKFVLLNKDENYLDEDELDGRSISEFHRWRLEEEGRLFFAPPRRMTNTTESRPLLKDHKGRPWRDAYASTGEGQSSSAIEEGQQATEDLPQDIEANDVKVRFFGRGSWSSGRLMFYLLFYGILQPVSFVIAALCWLFVFTIPIANLNRILCEHVRRRPLALHFEKEKDYYKRVANSKKSKNQSIILCTYRCCGLHYYKYTLGGTNIFFFNLLLVVFLVIFDYYALKEGLGWDTWYTDSSFLFCGCLFSIIPLAYFIGQAVASISAQSSMGVGAVINAFFSTVVEIFLYCVALNQSKGKLVEGSMIGSILGGVLLLPGLSMCGGALKRKTQRYNPRSAGVSSTMLLFAMLVMFAPSLFYQMYGTYEIRCRACDHTDISDCTTCQFTQPNLNLDALYYNVLRPFSLLVALALFLAYVCGLYFTLKTHASLIWATNSHEQQAAQTRKDANGWRSPSIVSLEQTSVARVHSSSRHDHTSHFPTGLRSGLSSPGMEGPKKRHLVSLKLAPAEPLVHKDSEADVTMNDDSGGHDAPNWSNTKSSVILLGSTILYAIIAEILVDNVDAVLSHFPINPKFLGLTVFALVPNTTEFVNAISFAVGGNVALSMEIGSAYALQVVLIQIPSLVVYSVVKGYTNIEMIFPLIFPRWDVIATLASIYLFTYVYAEGKSNYFKGVILILIYIVVLVGFYMDDVVADLDEVREVSAPAMEMLSRILSR
ncbi:hypothetical protein METBIDRAFT_31630 [Metschnikowia bicuspidata var. bicuspidata NRRL YB-4993]|uniref:Calcium permease n=1 Tax=Metschnikowia bicuspidata var. bicuspidata NRRL YB-4993 TaxID=869754 RepID=A0A1A0HA33_9ASCO|nr:hypothetical protein METBIDRAFT_31630 [Metschnikowia bicuspidata var. bicuspidata NRRL YB-4993]OBA20989.1 hypothetical protein METBIDRAFT_31630 [Metschnikowia bicuspidata var. bicuspidata NRRL YB-4993]